MDCAEWNGARDQKGYGKRWDPERKVVVLAHRYAIAQVVGWENVLGKVVWHTCDNPPCVNVEHLRIGTHADNVADKMAKGRGAGMFQPVNTTHCRNGHLLDEANTYWRKDRPSVRECKTCRREAVNRSRR